MSNLIVNKLSKNKYQINVTTSVKNDYPIESEIIIDSLSYRKGATSSLFPLEVDLFNFHEIVLKSHGTNSTYTETKCLLADEELYCQLIDKLSSLNKEELNKNKMASLYWILQNPLENNACNCLCFNMKKIYNELVNMIKDKNCCC